MITKLREFMTPDQLTAVYDHSYDHKQWPEHIIRVTKTIEIASEFGQGKAWEWGADLSCGDGAILDALVKNGTVRHGTYGDLVQREGLDVVGPIETTLSRVGSYDLFICSETLEHVQNPARLMRGIRDVTTHAIFTTPIAETAAHGNYEHYWAWEVSDIEDLLIKTGWGDLRVTVLDCDFYSYQIWCCS